MFRPTSKHTLVFPNESYSSPVATVFVDPQGITDGSDWMLLTQQIIEANTGTIMQFISAARQDLNLSESTYAARVAVMPQLVVEYSSNQGLETLYLFVSPVSNNQPAPEQLKIPAGQVFHIYIPFTGWPMPGYLAGKIPMYPESLDVHSVYDIFAVPSAPGPTSAMHPASGTTPAMYKSVSPVQTPGNYFSSGGYILDTNGAANVADPTWWTPNVAGSAILTRPLYKKEYFEVAIKTLPRKAIVLPVGVNMLVDPDINDWATPTIGVVPQYYLPTDLQSRTPQDSVELFCDYGMQVGMDLLDGSNRSIYTLPMVRGSSTQSTSSVQTFNDMYVVTNMPVVQPGDTVNGLALGVGCFDWQGYQQQLMAGGQATLKPGTDYLIYTASPGVALSPTVFSGASISNGMIGLGPVYVSSGGALTVLRAIIIELAGTYSGTIPGGGGFPSYSADGNWCFVEVNPGDNGGLFWSNAREGDGTPAPFNFYLTDGTTNFVPWTIKKVAGGTVSSTFNTTHLYGDYSASLDTQYGSWVGMTVLNTGYYTIDQSIINLMNDGAHTPVMVGNFLMWPYLSGNTGAPPVGDGSAIGAPISQYSGVDLGQLAEGDVIMVAVDTTTRQVWFGKNGSWFGSPSNGSGHAGLMDGTEKTDPYYPAVGYRLGDFAADIRAGAGLSYSPPSGFKSYGVADTTISY